MKVKLDFVTNSSSTIWIVHIPDNFSIEIDEIHSYLKENYSEDDYKDISIEEELEESLRLLKERDNLWSYGIDGIHFTIFDAIIGIIEDRGLLLSTAEVSGEGSNMIVTISTEQIINAYLSTLDPNETFKFLKEDEDEK